MLHLLLAFGDSSFLLCDTLHLVMQDILFLFFKPLFGTFVFISGTLLGKNASELLLAATIEGLTGSL